MNNVDELIKALRCNGRNLENCRKCDYSIFTDGGMPICNKETRIYKKAADALEQLRAENISLRAERDALLKSTTKVSEKIETIQPRGLLE